MTRSHSFVQPFWRRLHMRRKPNRRKIGRPKTRLGLPDLDQSKAAVIGSLRSPESQRGYGHAIDEFIDWYCSEPRLSFNRTVVLRFLAGVCLGAANDGALLGVQTTISRSRERSDRHRTHRVSTNGPESGPHLPKCRLSAHAKSIGAPLQTIRNRKYWKLAIFVIASRQMQSA